jgi:hypothetical protein
MAVVMPDHIREPTPVGIYSWDFATSIRTLFTLVRSEADSREQGNSADVHTFLFKCWSLASRLGPLWPHFGRMHPR